MRLHYSIPNDLSKLHDELIAAVPALRPIPDSEPNPVTPNALRAVMTIEGLGDDVWLTVPDGLSAEDEAAIAAVVAAHDPVPEPTAPTQAEQVDVLVASGKAALEAAASLDEVKAVFAGALDGLGAIYGTAPGEQP